MSKLKDQEVVNCVYSYFVHRGHGISHNARLRDENGHPSVVGLFIPHDRYNPALEKESLTNIVDAGGLVDRSSMILLHDLHHRVIKHIYRKNEKGSTYLIGRGAAIKSIRTVLNVMTTRYLLDEYSYVEVGWISPRKPWTLTEPTFRVFTTSNTNVSSATSHYNYEISSRSWNSYISQGGTSE